ncbi:AsmA protein [Bacteriovorax sp. Seq25_V]|uniref:AsmA protein n=1 Tax=Bacteriovorax sp. Seq25_V TaxID=1201288 RepID=UPI00038A4078|nr:AsmA protein [Bacteriovorax sp. Seq25_V]EQC43376.1 AsmA-like C-terminal domain protein [Bacteriovorax sp. Seq25_V]
MKTKSPLKIIFIAFISFTIILSGAIFYASKKLKPEELKHIMVGQLESAFPNSIVKTSSVDFSLGLTSVLNIHGVDITLKKPRAFPLLQLDNLRLEIPFWAILFGGGKIELVANSPKVNYIEFDKTSNWVYAMTAKNAKVTTKKVENTKKDDNGSVEEESSELVIPGFIAASELNIKVQNLELDYKLADKSSGQINVEKLLLKDVGVKSTTAFELKSALDLLKGTPNHTKLDLLIIGESHLFNYIKNKELEVKSQVILSNIENSLVLRPIKKISLNSSMHLKKDKSILVDFVTSLEEKQILKGKFESNKGASRVKDLELNLVIRDILDLVIAADKLPLLLNGGEQFEMKGEVELGENLIPNIDFNTIKTIKVKKDNIVADVSVSGTLKKSGLRANVDVDVFSGKVSAMTSLSTNWKSESFAKLAPIDINIVARDMKIDPTSFMANASEDTNVHKKNGTKAEVAEKNKAGPQKIVLLPVPVKVKTQFSNILIGTAKLTGVIDVVGAQKGINISSSNLRLDEGQIDLGANVTISGKDLKNSFDLKLNRLNLHSLVGMIPKGILDTLSGEVSGEIKGHAIGEKYFANVAVKLNQGKLEKINIGQYVDGFIEKLGPLKDKIDADSLKVNGEFSTLSFKGTFDNSRHQVTSSEFIDKGHKINFQSSGNIYLTGNKKSSLDVKLKVTDAKLAKQMKSAIGTDTFPMTLSGTGYALSPDYTKTLKSVGKSAIKEQGTQQLKKLLKGQDPKKLLKGLFK